MKHLEKLYIFTSFIAIEQIQRWKYMVCLTFPLRLRRRRYTIKREYFWDYVHHLTKLQMWIYHNKRFLYVWFAEENEFKDFTFYLFVAHDFDLRPQEFKTAWYEDCVTIYSIAEWNFWIWKHDWDFWEYVRIYKKIYDISIFKYQLIKYCLERLERKYLGYSFDYRIVMKNIYTYIYFYLHMLEYTIKWMLIFPSNLWDIVYYDFFYRWKSEEVILANGLHHLTDPLIIYDWCYSWKKFFNINYKLVIKRIKYILSKAKYSNSLIADFFKLLDISELESILDMVYLFLFIYSFKNIYVSLIDLYLRLGNIICNFLYKGSGFFCFQKQKYIRRLGKFFYNCILIELKDFVKIEKIISKNKIVNKNRIKGKKVNVKFIFIDEIYHR